MTFVLLLIFVLVAGFAAKPSRRALYCHACSWAYGSEEYDRARPKTAESDRGGRRGGTE
jgi:hypothetical protein